MRLDEIDIKNKKKAITEGITHIDDQKVPVEEFLNVVKNLHEYEITEKVDGSNLKFGLDDNKRFFTSRDGKEGGYYYNQDDWGNEFKDTGFKSAHAALQEHESLFQIAGMPAGTVIEAEILFGDKPNAIPYWPNQIILLRVIQGEVDLEELSEKLADEKTKVQVNNVPYTEDGYTIRERNEDHVWNFTKVQKYEPNLDHIAQLLKKHVAKLEKFLYQPNIAGLELTNDKNKTETPTNVEVMALRTSKTNKEAKQLVMDVVDGKKDPETGKRTGNDGLRYNIKTILLKQLIRNAQSSLGPKMEEGGWIEGVVLKKTTGDEDEMWKIVDRDVFTAVNQFNHQIRQLISDKHKGVKTPKSAAGLIGNMLRDMATETGHMSLGTNQAKRYVKNHGSTKSEILHNLATDMDFNAVKASWPNIINETEQNLNQMLSDYNRDYQKLSFNDVSGRTHKYDETIHARTLQVFASLFKQMNDWKGAIAKSRKSEDLLMILIGDKLP